MDAPNDTVSHRGDIPGTLTFAAENHRKHAERERLEAEITELWGHINAATYRFLALLAEFDRTEGWAAHGLASCAQWLNWQCGIGAVAAREKVRVARALEALPRIADAFRCGVLSYSKVRAITRIAAPENEADLLNIAEHGTASHVERLVAKYRRVERAHDAAAANGLQRHRGLYFFYEDDGSVVIHAKLPPEVGALVHQAIEAALELVEAEAAETRSNVSAETRDVPRASADSETGEAAYEHALPVEEKPQDTFAAKRADALRVLAETFLARRCETLGSVADRFQVVVHIDQRALTRSADVRERALRAHPGGSDRDDELHAKLARCSIGEERTLPLETARRLGCDASVVGIVENEHGEPLDVGRKTRSIPPALARALKARDDGCRFPGCNRTRFTEGHHVVHWADGGETKLGNLVTLCRFHHRLVHEGGFGLRAIEGESRREVGNGRGRMPGGSAAASSGSQAIAFVFTRPDGTRIEPNGRGCFRGNVHIVPADRSGAGSHRADPANERPGLIDLNRAAGLAIDATTSRCRWLGESMDYGLAIGTLWHKREQARGSPPAVAH